MTVSNSLLMSDVAEHDSKTSQVLKIENTFKMMYGIDDRLRVRSSWRIALLVCSDLSCLTWNRFSLLRRNYCGVRKNRISRFYSGYQGFITDIKVLFKAAFRVIVSGDV